MASLLAAITPGHVFGVAGVAVSLWALAQTRDDRLKLGIAAGALLFGAGYALLAAWAGVAAMGYVIARQLLALVLVNRGRRARLTWTGVFLVLLTVVTAWTWKGPWSALPWLASMVSTHAYLTCGGAALRRRLAVSDVIWATYAGATGAWPHLLFTLCALALNLRTARRLAAPS